MLKVGGEASHDRGVPLFRYGKFGATFGKLVELVINGVQTAALKEDELEAQDDQNLFGGHHWPVIAFSILSCHFILPHFAVHFLGCLCGNVSEDVHPVDCQKDGPIAAHWVAREGTGTGSRNNGVGDGRIEFKWSSDDFKLLKDELVNGVLCSRDLISGWNGNPGVLRVCRGRSTRAHVELGPLRLAV